MFFIYWFVQAIWVFNISLPIIFINSSDKPFSDGSLSELDYVCIFGFAFAVAIEILADVNKAIWVKKGRQGGFCTGMYYSLSVCVSLCKKKLHTLTHSIIINKTKKYFHGTSHATQITLAKCFNGGQHLD